MKEILIVKNSHTDALKAAADLGGRPDLGITVIPRKDAPPGLIFTESYLDKERPHKEGLNAAALLLAAAACYSVPMSMETPAERLALAKQALEAANEMYDLVLDHWEKSK